MKLIDPVYLREKRSRGKHRIGLSYTHTHTHTDGRPWTTRPKWASVAVTHHLRQGEASSPAISNALVESIKPKRAGPVFD